MGLAVVVCWRHGMIHELGLRAGGRHLRSGLNWARYPWRHWLVHGLERLRHEDVQTTKSIYVDNNPVLQVERHDARMKRNGHSTANSPAVAPAADIRLTEEEALGLLDDHGLEITPRALRKAALKEGWGRQSGRKCAYSETVVRDLAANWMIKQDAQMKLRMTQPQYFHWTLKAGIATRVIGKASLVRRVDVRNEQRERGL